MEEPRIIPVEAPVLDVIAPGAGSGHGSAYLVIIDDETTIDTVADALTPAPVATPSMALQGQRVAAWRQSLVEEFGLPTSAEVADHLGSTAKNRAALASKLRSEGRIFAVELFGNLRYPGFQFTADGAVNPHVQPLLEALEPAALGGWEVTSWFTSANDQLDGAAPVDLLDDGSSFERLLEAARSESAEPGF